MAYHSKLNLHLIIVLIFPTLALCAPKVPCFFIFGDSVADNGNNNNLNTTSKVNYLPFGIDFPSGPTGRFTNGQNFVDFIAKLLGFEKPIPPYSNATIQDILTGLNYASGGAGILDQSGLYFGDVISLNKQLSTHKVTVSRIAKIIGGKRAAKQHLSSCIYSVGMGSNDYLANYLPQLYSSGSQDTPQQFADRLIAQYSKQLRKLYDQGARKVVVFGLGKLGCIPQQLVAYGITPGSTCFETTNNMVEIFNEKLKLLIGNLNSVLRNARLVYSTDVSDAVSYGNIKILSKPCCEGGCVEGTVPCSNRDEYYFWDDVHPTEAAYAIGADVAYTYISSLLGNTNLPTASVSSY